ncbi:YchJ family protein [Pseudoalteromonas luteoviolacea]|uniref:YchJ family protein n=1 Tax=Pseudoalteromonas luteoviolacea TaxID=43657 RepID=UPI001B37691B|nr:YchJ family protein [Pseudoalteromonas luteoviolacea]MBQ4814123.1 YchJ family protein [Pseudoalteromonas luteoviolacea]
MCFCGQALPFEQCCNLIITGQSKPENAEQLMRSRYSAYCAKNGEYIVNTYAAEKRLEHTVEDILLFANQVEFVHLDVINTGQDQNFQYVEFKASYLDGQQLEVLHERSRFIKEDGKWVYLDGNLFPCEGKKVSRNDPCPCLSGKKFKKCHG